MFDYCFHNVLLGTYRPDRQTLTIESGNSLDVERATLVHEQVHEFLTLQSTVGMAAFVCGNRKEDHDLTVLPNAKGERAKLDMPYLRHFRSTTAWIQEGAATACEAITWADITKRHKDEILQRKPSDYRLAASEFIEFVETIHSELEGVESHLRSFIETAVIQATGLLIISPHVPDSFYSAALNNEDSIFPILEAIPERRHVIFSLSPSQLINTLKPAIEDLLHHVNHSLDNLDRSLEDRFPGEHNAPFRARSAGFSDDPGVRASLTVFLADWIQFKMKVTHKLSQCAGLELGEIVPDVIRSLGVSVSFSQRNPQALFTDNGRRAHIVRPQKFHEEMGKLEELETVLSSDGEHLILPELVGPFLRDAGMVLLHAFDRSGKHITALNADFMPKQYSKVRSLYALALYRLVNTELHASAKCFGVVVPFGVNTTTLAQSVSGMPLVEVPHFGIDSDFLDCESLAGVYDGKGLIRQTLKDGRISWLVISYRAEEFIELENVMDRCFLWILANGGNAHSIWTHNTGGIS